VLRFGIYGGGGTSKVCYLAEGYEGKGRERGQGLEDVARA
jgi:hypothetical protein